MGLGAPAAADPPSAPRSRTGKELAQGVGGESRPWVGAVAPANPSCEQCVFLLLQWEAAACC